MIWSALVEAAVTAAMILLPLAAPALIPRHLRRRVTRAFERFGF